MPAKKKAAPPRIVTFTERQGVMLETPVTVKFPGYKPVGRTRAQTEALMKAKGMHPAMIKEATKHMKK